MQTKLRENINEVRIRKLEQNIKILEEDISLCEDALAYGMTIYKHKGKIRTIGGRLEEDKAVVKSYKAEIKKLKKGK